MESSGKPPLTKRPEIQRRRRVFRQLASAVRPSSGGQRPPAQRTAHPDPQRRNAGQRGQGWGASAGPGERRCAVSAALSKPERALSLRSGTPRNLARPRATNRRTDPFSTFTSRGSRPSTTGLRFRRRRCCGTGVCPTPRARADYDTSIPPLPHRCRSWRPRHAGCGLHRV